MFMNATAFELREFGTQFLLRGSPRRQYNLLRGDVPLLWPRTTRAGGEGMNEPAELSCPACHYTTVCSPAAMVEWLRGVRMVRKHGAARN